MRQLLIALSLIFCISSWSQSMGGGGISGGGVTGITSDSSGNPLYTGNGAGLTNIGGTFTSIGLSDGTVNNLSEIPFVMPWPMQLYLQSQYSNSLTAFWSTNGIDASAVLGDPTHPSLTFTNAFALLPSTNGTIWAFPNQTNTLPLATFAWNKNATLIGNNGVFGIGGANPLFQCTSNIAIYGGSWDFIITPTASISSTFSYCTLFPDYSTALNIDDWNVGANVNGNQFLNVNWCKFFGANDIFNQTAGTHGFSGPGSVETVTHSWIVSSGTGLSAVVRGFVAKGTNSVLIKECLIVAVNSRIGGGSSVTNVCVVAINGAKVTLDNDTLICGTPGYDIGYDINGSGVGTIVYVENMALPVLLNTDGVASIYPLFSSANLSPLAFNVGTSTNALLVTTAGLTNNTGNIYSLNITAGTAMTLSDTNGTLILTPIINGTYPLKPGWRFAGTATTGTCVNSQ